MIAIKDHLPHLFLNTIWHCVRLREHKVTDQNFGAILQRGNEVLEDLDALLVRPVMQDEAKEVGIRTLDRLRFEEVVFHKLHSTVIFLRKRLLGILHFFLVEILDDEFPNLGVFGYFERGMAA